MDVQSSDPHSSFASALAETLPVGVKFTIYHLSSPPTRCEPIFATPPNEDPDRTYCESHYLSIAVQTGGFEHQLHSAQHILVFAIEVLIYTTTTLTTIFVSKADSTGYLHLLNLPKGTPSPLKAVASTFLDHLVRTRRRSGVNLTISLFARAQDQYLFPGSIENAGKHLLDDRGLIRWWCQVTDLLVRKYKGVQDSTQRTQDNSQHLESTSLTKGYIIVPGLDKVEILHLLPSSVRSEPSTDRRWTVGHPLYLLSQRSDLPPRCLIPHFPDDPKARFIDELDEELADVTHTDPSVSPSKSRRSKGRWQSVTDLDRFWEAMEFRQECSSGRMVGFIWVVFPAERSVKKEDRTVLAIDSSKILGSSQDPTEEHPSIISQSQSELQRRHISQNPSHSASTLAVDEQKSSKQPSSRPQESSASSRKGKRPRLSGPIIARQPRIKGATSLSSTSKRPTQTPYYIWPTAGRGQLVLDGKDYTRVTEFLLKLDFANLEMARTSTARWLQEVQAIAPILRNESWGEVVLGRNHIQTVPTASANTEERVNTLDVGMIRKKRKKIE